MARKNFNSTEYNNLNEFIYGTAKYPVVLKNGMSIGEACVP